MGRAHPGGQAGRNRRSADCHPGASGPAQPLSGCPSERSGYARKQAGAGWLSAGRRGDSVRQVPFDHPWAALSPASLAASLQFLSSLHGRSFDRVVVMHHLITRWGALKYAALGLATGAGRRLGADNGRGWFYTERAADTGYGGRHEVECWLDLVGRWGAEESDTRLQITLSSEDEREGGRLVSCPTCPALFTPSTLAAGPTLRPRRWPPERFAAVADGLLTDWGGSAVLLGGEHNCSLLSPTNCNCSLLSPTNCNCSLLSPTNCNCTLLSPTNCNCSLLSPTNLTVAYSAQQTVAVAY